MDECHEQLAINFSAKTVKLFNQFRGNNSFAVLYEKDPSTGGLIRRGNTETFINSCNPEWTESVTIDYLFEIAQHMTVKIFNEAETPENLLGEATFILSKLFDRRHGHLSLPLSLNGGQFGTIEIRASKIVENRDMLKGRFEFNLTNTTRTFIDPNPYILFKRVNEDASWTRVWRSKRASRSLEPVFDVEIPLSRLCNGDIFCTLKLQIWDKKNDGDDLMGEVETSVETLLRAFNGAVRVDLLFDNKAVGYFVFLAAKIDLRPTFTEYLGEVEFNLITAIDYTLSNGDPNNLANPDRTNSLHYINPDDEYAYNPYQMAIVSVGTTLSQYDYDQKYPVYGFGARVRPAPGQPASPVKHCFKVSETEADGIDGILQQYKDSFKRVVLSGPTLFNPLIREAARIARENEAEVAKAKAAGETDAVLKYTILLIITDGDISDFLETKKVIVEDACNTALSIIIVGVGKKGNFEDMEKLDSDKNMLTYQNQAAARDIVQFIPYNAVEGRGATAISQQALAEIPEQVIQYFESKNLFPQAFLERIEESRRP